MTVIIKREKPWWLEEYFFNDLMIKRCRYKEQSRKLKALTLSHRIVMSSIRSRIVEFQEDDIRESLLKFVACLVLDENLSNTLDDSEKFNPL